MELSEMKRLKQELGLSNDFIAAFTKVPLSTVQKIFGGFVSSPRKSTIDKLSSLFEKGRPQSTGAGDDGASMAREAVFRYGAEAEDDYEEDNGVKPAVNEKKRSIEGEARKKGGYTVEDLRKLPEEERAELIDGVIYYLSAPRVNHQRVIRLIFEQLFSNHEKCGKDCEILFAPVDVQLDKDKWTMVQPDLIVFCDRELDNGRCLFGAPDFLIEVISKSTKEKDEVVKLNKYWRAGVSEYWIVDYEENKVTKHFFDGGLKTTFYTMDDKVPVGISDGKCEIDMKRIKNELR